MKISSILAAVATLFLTGLPAFCKDPDFHIFLCFGQSNIDGFPGLEEENKGPVNYRLKMLAAVDLPRLERTKDHWYPKPK